MKVLILGRNGLPGLLEAPVPISAIARADYPTSVRRHRSGMLDRSSTYAALRWQSKRCRVDRLRMLKGASGPAIRRYQRMRRTRRLLPARRPWVTWSVRIITATDFNVRRATAPGTSGRISSRKANSLDRWYCVAWQADACLSRWLEHS